MRSTWVLRGLGAVALLGVAAVHLYEYYVDHYSAIPTIGTLFLLNAASAIVLALALLAPAQRLAPRRLPRLAPNGADIFAHFVCLRRAVRRIAARIFGAG